MDNKTETTTTQATQPTEDRLFRIKSYIVSFIKDALDLEHGVDKLLTINEIKDKKSMSGANAWMLMCSIVIASVGLDLNSPAVIIGAMLISPLMSPILGIGLAVGINDKNTLKKSLAHFGMAVTIALITSTIYFWLTPLGESTPAIMSRTEPGPLDILIAFFGGVAGIISIARKDILTTLPGVAIATALMPPLCVTGFGIANGYGDIVLSSLFLFFINTVFVSFATYIIVRFVLHFPQRDFTDAREKRNNTIYISLFLLSICVISYFPFSKILRTRDRDQKVEKFIDQVFEGKSELFDGKEMISSGDSSLLILKVYGDGKEFMTEDSHKSITEKIGLKNTTVRIVPTTNINEDDINGLRLEILSVQDATNQLNTIKEKSSENDIVIEALKEKLTTFRMQDDLFKERTGFIKAIYPDEISSVTYARGQTNDFAEIKENIPMYVIDWNKKEEDYEKKQEVIQRVLKTQRNMEGVRVIHNY
ncbi:MAG: putative hydrophobic protein (TIGR00271 family) [Saprospiraceae bacterium]|jgi:uncharacterized hydrophobic protein (TIGR00271 family)